MKKIKCRDHGGFFMVAPRRGRPPVRCSPDNKCDAQTIAKAPSTVKPAKLFSHAAPSVTRTSAATAAPASASDSATNANWSDRRAETVKQINRIFGELSKLGWLPKRSWVDKSTAEITAVRGEEMIYIIVTDGKATTQYSLWSFDKPSTNGKPASKLSFDPEEIGDGELARFLVGMKVTWYNRLSGKEETGYCGRENIRIEHGYNAMGDEVPGQRVIKFVDADARNFRAFQLDQLLKVGR